MQMRRVFIFLIVFAFTGCSEEAVSTPDSEIRIMFKQAFTAESSESLASHIFLPAKLEEEQKKRILNHRVVLNAKIKKRIEIEQVTIRGRWASVVLAGDTNTPLKRPHIAFRSSEGWKLFWDPQATLLWGQQEWHQGLSQSDWDDYRALTK